MGVTQGVIGAIAAGGGGATLYGYICGGYIGSYGIDDVNRIAFDDDTVSAMTNKLNNNIGPGWYNYNGNGQANAGVAGYYGGGTNREIEKMPFATEAWTVLSATLSGSPIRYYAAGCSNSGSFGYWAGGWGSPDSTVDKQTFSNDTMSTLGTGLSYAPGGANGMADVGTAGYYAGGHGFNTIDKFAFSNDARSTLSATLSDNKYAGVAMTNSGTAGYVGGGGATSINKIAFSNDARTTLSAVLASTATLSGGMANSGTAGYGAVGGGSSGDVDKLSFSGETISQLSGTISPSRRRLGAMADSSF